MDKQGRHSTFIGIDVARDRLDVHLLPAGEAFFVARDEEGLSILIERIRRLDAPFVCLEATGGYEMDVVDALAEAAIPVVVINPRQVRDFARATARLAKTDSLDAEVIAAFAKAVRPPVRPLPNDQERRFSALSRRRRQLTAMLATEKTRLKRERHRAIGERIAAHIDWLSAERDILDRDLKAMVQADAGWRQKARLLQSVPGVGETTAIALIAGLPELGTLERNPIAALVGVAPINRDSGTMRGRRMIFGGRKHIRGALYMATVSAVQCNPPIKAMRDRLKAQGKPPKLVLTACLRKLLIVLNAVLRDQKEWKTA